MRLLTGDARREIVNGHKKPLFSGRLWINNDMNI